mmetsp:Transcript_3272/g.12481  ORF Transcript_3272/g.12481 Transcript_3272/m.12481 type:complete len:339 (-) Transcript_3272:233-1249(-)
MGSNASSSLYATAGMSPGVLNDLMKRLEQVYEESGGTVASEEDITEGLSPFDAHKLLISKKIQMTRERMKKRDEAVKAKKGIRITAKLNKEVIQMIDFLKADRKKMMEIHQKNAKKVKNKKKFGFRKTKLTPDDIDKQEKDILLLTRHIVELEEMNKARHRKKNSRAGGSSRERNTLLEGHEADVENADDDTSMGAMRKLVMESDLPDDATRSNLPELDISQALEKVHNLDKQIEEGLDEFNKKLKDLKAQAQTIGTELDEQSELIDQIQGKSDKAKEKIDRLNQRLDKAMNQVNKTQKLICMIFLLCIILIFAVIALVLIATGPSWGFNVPDVSELV